MVRILLYFDIFYENSYNNGEKCSKIKNELFLHVEFNLFKKGKRNNKIKVASLKKIKHPT